MTDNTKTTPKSSAVTVILIGLVHLVVFGWIVYTNEKMLYKILFGVMGVFLFIGIVDKIRGKSPDEESTNEKPLDEKQED